MPVVLDNDAGERVLLYGADGSTLRKLVVDSSGRLVVVGVAGGTAVIVSATDLDIRNLAKTQDEVYAVLRTDAGAAYDARTRSWTITEDVSVVQDAAGDLKAAVHGIDGSTQRQVKVDSTARQVVVPEWDSAGEGFYDDTVGNHGDTSRFDVTLATTTAGRLIALYAVLDQLTTNQAAFMYVTLDPASGVVNREVFRMYGSNTGITVVQFYPNIDLRPGDRLTGHTGNSDGANRRFILQALYLLRTI